MLNMRSLHKSKRVSWASDLDLCQVIIIFHTPNLTSISERSVTDSNGYRSIISFLSPKLPFFRLVSLIDFFFCTFYPYK